MGDAMQSFNRHAFKEWSVVCAALANGKQSLILRKGGVEDGAEGIRVEKPEFWLYPTFLHQEQHKHGGSSDSLSTPAARNTSVLDATVRIQHYAVVHRAEFIPTEVALARLQKFHIWSSSTIVQRFHYRKPGLWLLIVRIYQATTPVELPQSEEMAGCRTWVELPRELPTADLQPVLSDAEFAHRCREIEAQLV